VRHFDAAQLGIELFEIGDGAIQLDRLCDPGPHAHAKQLHRGGKRIALRLELFNPCGEPLGFRRKIGALFPKPAGDLRLDRELFHRCVHDVVPFVRG
jgi:hypothetical protein